MLLAMAETSGAVNRLFVSMPSVSTTIAERCGTFPTPPETDSATAFAVSAIASKSDVWPKGGSTLSTFASSPLKSVVKSVTFSSCGVEGEERRLVALLQRAEEMTSGLLRVDGFRPDPHASTDVKEQRHLDRPVGLGVEPHNRPPLAAFDDDEVFAGQARNEPTLLVPHDRRHRHEVDRRFEPRARILNRHRSPLGTHYPRQKP